MRRLFILSSLCVILIRLPASGGWSRGEHITLGDRAFVLTAREAGLRLEDLMQALILGCDREIADSQSFPNLSFGEWCAWFAGPDRHPSRFHARGKTILQQLAYLSGDRLESAWQARRGGRVIKTDRGVRTVVANYFLYHHLALRFASQAAMSGSSNLETLGCALIYEALAQGYLADAFTAGHLLVPMQDRWSRLHRVNNRKGVEHHNREGVYVINSRGEVWIAFGNHLLEWYPPNYEKVLEACTCSLRELFLVYHAQQPDHKIPPALAQWGESAAEGRDIRDWIGLWLSVKEGIVYYAELRLPTLLLLPMPVSAAWSLRLGEKDSHGIHRRRIYPQLREPGFHDPDLIREEREFLYPRDAVPEWLIPPQLSDHSPEYLIRHDADIASVRFVQEWSLAPSFSGLLFSLAGEAAFTPGWQGLGTSVGLGYGLATDELILINNVSLQLSLSPGLRESRRFLLSPSMGFGLKLPSPFHLWEAYRVDLGYAFGLKDPYRAHGAVLGVGVEFPTFCLGFTYAGCTVRVLYRAYFLERTLHGLSLEMVLH